MTGSKDKFKRKRLILVLAAALFLLFLGFSLFINLGIYYKKTVDRNEYDDLSREEKERLKPGDLILRRGKSFASDFIALALDSNDDFSHSGIIVSINGVLHVVHTVSSSLSGIDGIQMQPLDEFIKLSQPDSTVVVRFKQNEFHPEKGEKIAARALYYLDRKIPFDHDFVLDNGDIYYCTELLWIIFNEVFDEKDLGFFEYTDNGVINVINFHSFVNPDYFNTIVDHLRHQE